MKITFLFYGRYNYFYYKTDSDSYLSVGTYRHVLKNCFAETVDLYLLPL